MCVCSCVFGVRVCVGMEAITVNTASTCFGTGCSGTLHVQRRLAATIVLTDREERALRVAVQR